MQIKYHLTYTPPVSLPKYLQYLYQAVMVIENLYITVFDEIDDYLGRGELNFDADVEVINEAYEKLNSRYEFFDYEAFTPMHTIMQLLNDDRSNELDTYNIAFCVLSEAMFFQKSLPILSKTMRRKGFTKMVTLSIVSEPETYEIRNRPADFHMSLNNYMRGLISVYERRIPKDKFFAEDDHFNILF